MNCILHDNQAYSLICIAPHKCQRKLCLECQYEHGVDVKLTMPINKFLEQVTKKMEGSKLVKENSEQTKQHMDFKQLIVNTEMMMKKLWEELTTSIKLIFDQIEKEDQQYTQLLDKNPNLAESSYSDLEQLVQILNGKILDDWKGQKISYSNQISSIKNQLEQDIKIFIQKFKEQIQEISSIFKINQSLFKWNVETRKINCLVWDSSYWRLNRTSFSIAFTDNQEIQYIKDGQILRIDKVKDISNQPQVMNNLEQIKYLNWSGNYGQNNKKNGRWYAKWQGEYLDSVEGEYVDGRKSGQWQDLAQNYWSQAQVYENGLYENDIRRGVWEFVYNYRKIGGGEYNYVGNKQGEWIDLFENFFRYAQVTYSGEYNMNNIKVGRWNIMYCEDRQREYKQMQILMNLQEYLNAIKQSGGGSYDQEGNQKKIGKWVELFEAFWFQAQVTYNGAYNMNGMKVGRWDIMYCDIYGDGKYKQIGGGLYDLEGNQKKIGKWVELDEQFYIQKKLTYNGEYNTNGMKVGIWDIMYCEDGQREYKKIGGGSYDQEGNQKKIGKWVELDENFYFYKQVTYNGDYNLKVRKVGQWDIMYCDINGNYKQIGGGSYDQEGNQIKIGKWVELWDGFGYKKQVTSNGEYNRNNMKLGRWDILYCKVGEEEYKQIGGGSYDQVGNQKKIGKWVELFEGFQEYAQVTYNGEYNMNGMKIGSWDIMYCQLNQQEYKQIINIKIQINSGGGSYDLEGNQKKIGKWVDLIEGFQFYSQVTYNGEYNKNGMKVGSWVIMYCQTNEQEYKQIGGGSYDQEGNQKKIGRWIELDEAIQTGSYSIKVTYNGEYNMKGEKVGIWVEMDILNNRKRGEKRYDD